MVRTSSAKFFRLSAYYKPLAITEREAPVGFVTLKLHAALAALPPALEELFLSCE